MRLSFWEITPVALFIVFIAPVAIVLVSLTGDYSDNWTHLYQYVLTRYIANTVYLVTGVSILVTIVGVGTAWLITNYNFTGKNIFEWALILPLAVPPYILAYTFTGLFDTYGTANNLIRDLFDLGREFTFFPKVRNTPVVKVDMAKWSTAPKSEIVSIMTNIKPPMIAGLIIGIPNL